MGFGKSEIKMILDKIELLTMLNEVLNEDGQIDVRYNPRGMDRIGINIMGGISDVSYSEDGIQCTLLGDDIWGFEISIPKNKETSIDCLIKHNIKFIENSSNEAEDEDLLALIDGDSKNKNFKEKIDEFYMSIDGIDIHMLIDKKKFYNIIGNLEDYVAKTKRRI